MLGLSSDSRSHRRERERGHRRPDLGRIMELMEPSAPGIRPAEDALAMAALYLVGEGTTVEGLAGRFGALGAVLARPRAAALLDRLVALGLVYTPVNQHDGAYYVPTSLGQGYTRAALAGQSDVAARLEELEHLR